MPTPRPRRRYTATDRAKAVGIASLSSVEAASEQLGIPRTTIDYWMDRPEFVELRSKTRDQVADEMWTAIQVGLAEVVKGLKDEAPLRDKATAVGILYDKHALLTGSATSRTEARDITGSLSDGDIIAAIREADRLAGSEGTSETAPSEAAG